MLRSVNDTESYKSTSIRVFSVHACFEVLDMLEQNITF